MYTCTAFLDKGMGQAWACLVVLCSAEAARCCPVCSDQTLSQSSVRQSVSVMCEEAPRHSSTPQFSRLTTTFAFAFLARFRLLSPTSPALCIRAPHRCLHIFDPRFAATCALHDRLLYLLSARGRPSVSRLGGAWEEGGQFSVEGGSSR